MLINVNNGAWYPTFHRNHVIFVGNPLIKEEFFSIHNDDSCGWKNLSALQLLKPHYRRPMGSLAYHETKDCHWLDTIATSRNPAHNAQRRPKSHKAISIDVAPSPFALIVRSLLASCGLCTALPCCTSLWTCPWCQIQSHSQIMSNIPES